MIFNRIICLFLQFYLNALPIDFTNSIVPFTNPLTTISITFTILSIISFKMNSIEVSIFASIVSGACAGFLIYNVYKAKVFMGDTGSLLLGGVISSVAIYIKNPLILVIVAIVPVIETISVILQVLYFRRTGKRLFRMAPLHHHFELSGWRENKVVVIFSLITLIACAIRNISYLNTKGKI